MIRAVVVPQHNPGPLPGSFGLVAGRFFGGTSQNDVENSSAILPIYLYSVHNFYMFFLLILRIDKTIFFGYNIARTEKYSRGSREIQSR